MPAMRRNALHAAGVPAARIGRVLPSTGARVTVL